jgi:hypothetical protein
MTLATLIGAVVVLSFVARSSNPVSRANFRRIEVGMPQAEVCSLLGAPEYEVEELGLVYGPETYTVNFGQSDEERRRRGFRDYRRQQWTSPEISIIVISDSEGKVVCRYSGKGREPYWLALLRSWLSRWRPPASVPVDQKKTGSQPVNGSRLGLCSNATRTPEAIRGPDPPASTSRRGTRKQPPSPRGRGRIASRKAAGSAGTSWCKTI